MTRVRLQVAVGIVALAVVAVVIAIVATRGSSSPAAGTGSTPLRITLPQDERAAERVLTQGAVPGLPTLGNLLLVASLPLKPRLAVLGVPPPPLRTHHLHLTPTRITLTPRVAPRVPSDSPPRVSPVHAIPGALPPGFVFHYDDDYHGWPTPPLHGPHVLHGGFDDPRAGGYHFGIDIAVDDSHPALLAPKGASHRVYAVEGGIMHWARNTQAKPCNSRRFDIGHFAYWHVEPTVRLGARVGRARWSAGRASTSGTCTCRSGRA